MEITISKLILAVVTVNPQKVMAGGAPVFVCENTEEMDRVATVLARASEGVTHDLGNGVYILMKH